MFIINKEFYMTGDNKQKFNLIIILINCEYNFIYIFMDIHIIVVQSQIEYSRTSLIGIWSMNA